LAHRIGDRLSALSFGPSLGGPWVWVGVCAFIAFGGTIIGALFGLFD
jgi:hypothetical protein